MHNAALFSDFAQKAKFCSRITDSRFTGVARARAAYHLSPVLSLSIYAELRQSERPINPHNRVPSRNLEAFAGPFLNKQQLAHQGSYGSYGAYGSFLWLLWSRLLPWSPCCFVKGL